MLTMLRSWTGSVEVNGITYNKISDVPAIAADKDIRIVLHPVNKVATESQTDNHVTETKSNELRITVKAYMTKPSSPEFDFMEKWNNDVPMPFRTMTGVKVKETRGMVYMKLHGDIWAEQIITCMCCGRVLTNPVSRYFGIGPECGGHHYVNPFSSDEELKKAVDEYRQKLLNITWEGWVIKSAITEEVEV